MCYLLLPLFLCTSLIGAYLPAQAQPSRQAVQVVDTRADRPIAYASVGVCSQPLGTVADATGTLPLTQVGAAPSDGIAISCVGYQLLKLLAGQLNPNATLRLKPTTTARAEVFVHGQRPKSVVMGHRTARIFASFGFYTRTDTVAHARLGREIGVLLPVRHSTQLQSFHMLTFGHNFRTLTFRLNLYAVQNDRPQNTLLRRDIIFSVNDLHRGWTEINLHSHKPKLTCIPTI